jgi:16S rRNA processing protein RimM
MDLTQVGYFSKTHGVKGHLILKVERDFAVEELKALFMDSPTGKAPYFVNDIKENNTGLIIGLEEVTAVEKAKLLLNKPVFIDSGLLEEGDEEFDWTGYEVIDRHQGSLGKVTSISDNGHQVLLSIPYKGKEVLLPLVEDFIEKIDEEGKKLFFNAPEGLIDLYISDDERETSQAE